MKSLSEKAGTKQPEEQIETVIDFVPDKENFDREKFLQTYLIPAMGIAFITIIDHFTRRQS